MPTIPLDLPLRLARAVARRALGGRPVRATLRAWLSDEPPAEPGPAPSDAPRAAAPEAAPAAPPPADAPSDPDPPEIALGEDDPEPVEVHRRGERDDFGPERTVGADDAEAHPTAAPAGAVSADEATARADDVEVSAVRVRSEATPNPNAMKFVCSVPVARGGALSFSNARAARNHPVGRALFAVDGVRLVFAVNDFVTVTKTADARWLELAPRIERALVESLARA